MSYEQENLKGILFKNDKGDNEKRPDVKGSITINGEKYWLSGWVNTPRDGKKWNTSLKATPAVESKTEGEFDDNIPF